MNSLQNNDANNGNNVNKVPTAYAFSVMLLIVIWVFIGLVAFITSLVCFSKSGTTLDKFLGLLLAIFLGPLYFIFFALSNSYCK
jgi:hypothetical protein